MLLKVSDYYLVKKVNTYEGMSGGGSPPPGLPGGGGALPAPGLPGTDGAALGAAGGILAGFEGAGFRILPGEVGAAAGALYLQGDIRH